MFKVLQVKHIQTRVSPQKPTKKTQQQPKRAFTIMIIIIITIAQLQVIHLCSINFRNFQMNRRERQTCLVSGWSCSSCEFDFVNVAPRHWLQSIPKLLTGYTDLENVSNPQLRTGQRKNKSPLTLLPRKRVHSLSVGLLNAFVFICPGSRDLGENRITLKRMPGHGIWSSGCGRGKHKLDVGDQPPQIFVMVSRSAADLSKRSKPELLGSFALRGAQRKVAISVPGGDAPTVVIQKKERKKKKTKRFSWKEFGGVLQCSFDCRVGDGDAGLGFLSDAAADAALRSFTSRRWLLRCASTCTDPGGTRAHPSPAQLLPAAGRCWVSAQDRDITDRRVGLSVPLFGRRGVDRMTESSRSSKDSARVTNMKKTAWW